MYGSKTISGTDGGRNPGVRYSEEDAVGVASVIARQRETQARWERNEYAIIYDLR